MTKNSDRPLQMILSFEGFINRTTACEEVHVSWRPSSYDLTNFEERVRVELAKLLDVGIGGIIVNVGYEDYLDNEDAWDRFLVGVRTAAELGMRIWIYDENGYPSGTAGGKVLQGHPELEAIGLKKMIVPVSERSLVISLPDPRGVLLGVYGIQADGQRERVPVEPGNSQARITTDGFQSIEVYFVAPLYEGTHAAGNYSSARRYVNLLNRKAVERFLDLTHAKYFEKIPADLRRHVEAFFTDEPSLMAHAADGPVPSVVEDPLNLDLPLFPSVPWCEEMETKFMDSHGYALAGHIPALFSGQGDHERRIRRDFWQTVSRLYETAYAEQMADACGALGIDCSGHFLGEDSLLQQVILHGDLIQGLEHFHRPGLDLLSCNPELFQNHILTHKSALSASFFGSRKRVMSETSNFIELYGNHKRSLGTPEIKCVLALQYLLGVRDFAMLFEWRRFAPEAYREINDFTGLLVETGEDKAYVPAVAVYLPIESAWEMYVPACQRQDIGGAGIGGKVLNVGNQELEGLCRLTTETIQRLFHSNVQYVLCEHNDIGRMMELGIGELAYYGPDGPDPDLVCACREAGVELVELAHYEASNRGKGNCEAGRNVVYATYDGFAFAVNYGKVRSAIAFEGSTEAVFPTEGPERKSISGSANLNPYECAFLFPPA